MSNIRISDCLFMSESDEESEEYAIELNCCDSGGDKKDTDIFFTIDLPINNKLINVNYIYIQGISNILLLRNYLDYVIDLHDRDLIP